MSEHGQSPGEQAVVPATALGRVATGIEDFIRPLYRWVGWGGALVIFGVIVAMIYASIGRYVGHPLEGAVDIQRMGLLLMIALAIGVEHMGHEKMVVDAIVNLFPKRLRAWIAPFVFFVVIVMLVVAVWQLIKLGISKQQSGEVTKSVMHLPKYPFVYILVYGVATLIPIYLARLLHSIDRLVKR